VLLPKKLFVLEKEMQPQKKVLEEKPQGDLLEVEDARASSFFITFDTNCKRTFFTLDVKTRTFRIEFFVNQDNLSTTLT